MKLLAPSRPFRALSAPWIWTLCLALALRALVPAGYMPDARALHDGRLEVTFCSAAGDVSSVTLVASSGFPDLDRAAQRAASQARFKPGTRDGQPAPASARLTLIFRLRDS